MQKTTTTAIENKSVGDRFCQRCCVLMFRERSNACLVFGVNLDSHLQLSYILIRRSPQCRSQINGNTEHTNYYYVSTNMEQEIYTQKYCLNWGLSKRKEFLCFVVQCTKIKWCFFCCRWKPDKVLCDNLQ